MAIYYAIGCDKHRESLTILRSSSAGMGAGPSFDGFFDFMQRHEYCSDSLRIFSENDPRYEDEWPDPPKE